MKVGLSRKKLHSPSLLYFLPRKIRVRHASFRNLFYILPFLVPCLFPNILPLSCTYFRAFVFAWQRPCRQIAKKDPNNIEDLSSSLVSFVQLSPCVTTHFSVYALFSEKASFLDCFCKTAVAPSLPISPPRPKKKPTYAARCEHSGIS